MKKLVNLNYKHYICISITLVFILISFLFFKYSYIRLYESFIDLFTSFKYYINNLFNLNWNYDITINNFSKVPFKLPLNLPSSWDKFKILCSNYFKNFFDKDNFLNYFSFLVKRLYKFSRFVLILLPFILILFIIIKSKNNINNNYNKDSKPLVIFKKFEDKLFIPINLWIKNFIKFLFTYSFYIKLWIFIWFINFNFITIIIEFIAYYVYFIASFNLLSIYIQVLKLLKDLSVVINFIPLFGWIIIFAICLSIIRKNIGYASLEHMECKNKGYINERPIVLFVIGTMGSKKTTLITDIALSEEVILRDKAFEKLLEIDLKFPYFPWINFENALKKAIKKHAVFNLASCKRFVRSKKINFEKQCSKKYLFYYDYKKYGTHYNDNLKIISIWDALEIYAQLYFIYVVESSLLISNYSIRTDIILNDLGNFPLWNTDFFKRDPMFMESYSRHSHILDFDTLRLGKKIVANNSKIGSFEFGVINTTEIGKERLNNLELLEIKKLDEVANQKNDLFNECLKMIRHAATVDNFSFVKFIADEQRLSSWGADGHELAEIIDIDECSDLNLCMPFFDLEYLLINRLLNKFKIKYANYRFRRGDNTLLMYLYHGLISKLYSYQIRIFNTFGYYKLTTLIDAGTLNKKQKKNYYYLMPKKIYSKRFATDAFNDIFNNSSLNSNIGLNDLEEYKTEKASFEELSKQNSYFVGRIFTYNNSIKDSSSEVNSNDFDDINLDDL